MFRLPAPLLPQPRRARRLLRAWRRLLGLLLALLTVLGGAAFQMRIGGLPPQQLTVRPAPQEQAHSHPGHAPAQAHRSQEHQGHGHAGHDHKAHCPFCVTQAFGEAVSPMVLELPPADFLPAALPQLRPAARAQPRCADARAPPHGAVARAAFVRSFAL